MPAQDTSKIKEKILFVFKKRGPSLPVHIAKETDLSILFASAFLSELLSERKLQISNMKVGSSPIYFIPEQRPLLENFSHYLKNKEKDAFALLKEKKSLRDKEQEPAIRVALRAIKDFAIPFNKEEEIFWRYFTVQEKKFQEEKTSTKPEEVRPSENFDKSDKIKNLSNSPENFEPKISEKETYSKSSSNELQESIIQKPQSDPNQDIEKKEIEKPIEEKIPKIDIFDEPLEEKKKKSEEKSEFIVTLLNYLNENKIKLIEETEIKKREFLGIGRIESDLGEIEILIVGKDKKKISEKDLKKIIEIGVENKMMILFLSGGEIEKKAKEFFRKYKNIIKLFKI